MLGSSKSSSTSNRVRNIVIAACALQTADDALLGAVYKALSEQMQVTPSQLGALTFAQSVSFSLSLPLWGAMVGRVPTKTLMATGCFMWATATVLLAVSTKYHVHFLLRLMNGGALAVVTPVGQAMICDIVPENARGWAFGMVESSCAALRIIVSFIATTIASQLVLGLEGWRWVHLMVATASAVVGVLLHMIVPEDRSSSSSEGSSIASWWDSQRRVVMSVLKKPSFLVLVAQGVTGAIPWNGMAFLTFYFQLSGYTDTQAARIRAFGGAGGVVGGLLGGWLGDIFGRRFPNSGRIKVAQSSIVLGEVMFILMMEVPYGNHSFEIVTLLFFLFSTVSCWTPASALRPICGELFTDSNERAQIVALWVALEGVTSSFLGAPMVGVLSEAYGFQDLGTLTDKETNVSALHSALLGVAVIPWALASLAWVPMYWTYPSDRQCKG